MSEITREWLEQEIADGDKEALRLLGKGLDPAGSEGTISLPDYVMLARLALIGLDAQERQPLLGQCTFDGCQYDQITALKGQLRTARSDALEEAAAWHDAQAKKLADDHAYYNGPSMGLDAKAIEHREHATAIRALKEST